MIALFDRLRSQTAAFVHDLLTIPVAWLLAYWLRFNLDRIPPEFWQGALQSLPWLLVIQGSVFWLFGLYRGVWRFASLPDLFRITRAVLAGSAVVIVILFLLNRSTYIPRSVPVLYAVIQLALLAGPRLLYRTLKDRRFNVSSSQRALIIGASHAGDTLVRELLNDPRQTFFPVGFVDDKPRRRGSSVRGLPVLGATEEIPAIVQRLGVDMLLLATPEAAAAEIRRLVGLCERAGVPFRILPELRHRLTDRIDIDQLRPVLIEDLLGRDPVELDWGELRAGLAGRNVLITGAGGSIGSELVRQIAGQQPARLILVDHGEYNLYRIEMELRGYHGTLDYACHLLDVTDPEAVARLFEREQPAIVFHAAAYKHVPLLETQVSAAIRNNVVGTRTVANAAALCGCERFVLISTDKAVNPTNLMGATKRVAELLCQELNARSPGRFITVRFGNVLGSAGSVVPLFRHQIERGGPVSVTHPEMERYFMTIPEACLLIMQAAVIGNGGETFVLEMGEPIRISYLAEQMIRLSGREPGTEIAIEYIGLRAGEKLTEELFYADETVSATGHPKIRVALCPERPDASALHSGLANVLAHLERGDDQALRDALKLLVPSWQTTQI